MALAMGPNERPGLVANERHPHFTSENPGADHRNEIVVFEAKLLGHHRVGHIVGRIKTTFELYLYPGDLPPSAGVHNDFACPGDFTPCIFAYFSAAFDLNIPKPKSYCNNPVTFRFSLGLREPIDWKSSGPNYRRTSPHYQR